uniref:Uncharacterized protein n=1 Tax=Lepeophtheirus salmonis TaxID=72036 RepID=A0A0K2UQZ3_LEPSM
MWSLTRTHLSS